MSTAGGTVAVSTSDTGPLSTNHRWRLAKRIAFRFAFAYLVLYQLPLPLGALPWTDSLGLKDQAIWQAIVPWVGKHIIHLSSDVSTASTGSGDRIYDWILALCYLTLAVADWRRIPFGEENISLREVRWRAIIIHRLRSVPL